MRLPFIGRIPHTGKKEWPDKLPNETCGSTYYKEEERKLRLVEKALEDGIPLELTGLSRPEIARYVRELKRQGRWEEYYEG